MDTENIAPVAEKSIIEQFPEPPVDCFCDLVMKGGITSGIVYPRAIDRLSHYYYFRGIGGTSAGAIAAAITAAAEYQRRKNGSRKGFNLLRELPHQLGLPSFLNNNRSKLFSLFQPQPNTRRLFAVLVKTLNRSNTRSRWLGGLKGLLLAYWPATAVSTAFAFLFVLNGAWFTGLLSLFIALLVSLCILVYFDITRGVVANGFGLCNGMTEQKDLEALTPWLHEMIQFAAGRGKNDKPLTFGDLWDADDKFPPGWIKVSAEVNETRNRSIDLQMFSTNLTHGRPYVFPLTEPETGKSKFRSRERLYFTEEEMRHYLPDNIVKWMAENSKPYSVEKGREGIDPSIEAGMGMRELPQPKDFPVLMAARMSLAFPFLISAIPLHAINHDLPSGKRKFQRCWFSDGGISSNFPIHLFDGLVPIWPTFGIHLEPEIKDRAEIYLPLRYDQGYGEAWNLFADKPKSIGKLGGFISAIINAMQNWNDNTLRRLPGFRDRVVRIRLKEGEGGMNLDMKPDIIEDLAKRGEDAANELIRRFAIKSPDGGQASGWDEHRFVRFNNLLRMMKARAPGLLNALSDDSKYATSLQDLLKRFNSITDTNGNLILPPGYEEPMTQEERNAYERILAILDILATKLVDPSNNISFKSIPKPEAELRVRPPL